MVHHRISKVRRPVAGHQIRPPLRYRKKDQAMTTSTARPARTTSATTKGGKADPRLCTGRVRGRDVAGIGILLFRKKSLQP
jgi:hypothetical protein